MNAIVFPKGGKKQLSVVDAYLCEDQRQDVHKAIHRFFVQEKKGILFTNGTGSGKTHLGCGLTSAFAAHKKSVVLIVAPTDKILSGWQQTLLLRGFNSKIISQTSTPTACTVSLMTYAAFRQCPALFNVIFDLLIFDECHHLLMNMAGDSTNGLDRMRAIAGLQRGFHYRVKNSSQPLSSPLSPEILHAQAEERTKVLLLSSTPFSSHKCVDFGDGLIFDYGQEPHTRGYNTPSAKEQFYIDHFGYSFRYGRLQRPDVQVDLPLMERKFHSYLASTGALSYRPLSVGVDYSRHFILVHSGIGAQIDAAINTLRIGSYHNLIAHRLGIFSKTRQKQLIEAIKANAAVLRIRQHLALGRKIVVYHSFIHDSLDMPFDFKTDIDSVSDDEIRHKTKAELSLFQQSHPELSLLSTSSLRPAIQTLVDAFGNRSGVINGTVSKAKRRRLIDEFNCPSGSIDVLIVQEKAGREGICLDDTVGNTPRVLMQLGLPADPISCIQIEGRIRRRSSASNAIYEYFNTGTDFELNTFAVAISERSELVENLACGDSARNLKANFIAGFLNSTNDDPNLDQGTGGLALDTRQSTIDIWDQAKSRYFSIMKKTAATKSAEGFDFYASPAPVGLFMCLLARLKPGQSLLEPSAGFGSIAQWCPQDVKLTCVEPSYSLFQKLSINLNRRATLHNHSFEDLWGGNKFDCIVMNPPFGIGGKLASEHVKKACLHLRGTGRFVALVPDTEQMDKRLQKVIRDLAQDCVIVRVGEEFILPAVTFERAGTSVKTKILVILRAPDAFSRIVDIPIKRFDFSSVTKISDLFSRLKSHADANLKSQSSSYSLVHQIPMLDIKCDELPVVIIPPDDSHKHADIRNPLPKPCEFEQLSFFT